MVPDFSQTTLSVCMILRMSDFAISFEFNLLCTQVVWSLTTSRSLSRTLWQVTSRRFHRSLCSFLPTYPCHLALSPSYVLTLALTLCRPSRWPMNRPRVTSWRGCHVIHCMTSLSIAGQRYYTVPQKNDADQPVLIIFGGDVPDRACYQTVICYPTSPN